MREYVKKDFNKDEFDGVYPFNLSELPFTKYKSFGEKNPDKLFYVIYRKPFEAGFFSNFMYVARHLKLIENTNFIPVVDFENFKTIYNNDIPLNGINNSWEYYFEQPSQYSLEEVYQSKNVFFCDGKYPHDVEFQPGEEKMYFEKIFKVKPNILEFLSQYDKYFENNNVLGIHFRGKDMNIFPGHRFAPIVKQMFKYTDEIIEKFNINKIFLATDEDDYLKAFIQRYGDRVFYTEAFRDSDVNIFNVNPRINHRYLLGQEVLLDLLLLLKCNGLLHGGSNITDVAKTLKPDFDFVYSINNGTNVKNKYYARYLYKIKQRLPKFLGGLLEEVNILTNRKGRNE